MKIGELMQEEGPEEEVPTEDVGAEAGAEQDPESMGGEDMPTPEEQEAYDKAVSIAMSLMHNKQSSSKFVKNLKAGRKNPVPTLAQMTVTLVTQADERMKGEIPEDVIIPMAEEILNIVGEFAHEVGAFRITQPILEKAMSGVIGQLVKIYQAEDEAAEYGKGLQELDQYKRAKQEAGEEVEPELMAREDEEPMR